MSSPDAEFRHFWIARGAVDGAETWELLTGGNTNETWRVGSRIVKRFREGGETPIFGNDVRSERLALKALKGTGLAPELVDAKGDTVVYERVIGHGWRPEDGVEMVAEALRALHAQPIPDELSHVDLRKDAMARQTLSMNGKVPRVPAELPPEKQVFLHGDATAANVLVDESGVTFIDWQCPAYGDAASDLAVFLSPAMQFMSGNEPLDAAQVDAFLEAYGEEDVTARYRALAPLYSARMRAYCQWRAARGDQGYGRAAALEQTAN
ncbi:phosphotransferase family protein [Maritimibacter dapengensis]|uniref:Aminoglycoside phosphotransferase family protein n=1 Tax=Maritimibacter dapengensis TaxID=2836868 RepID=A0ABS6T4F0_9RHOB|nr:aminoglycoside phosphotransferase family protein [Maritimibacter dapengensis]